MCWGGRGLTIAGRIQIFKTLAISKTLYMSTMRTPPTQFLDLLNSIQKDFIWNSSRAKIKHCSSWQITKREVIKILTFHPNS